MARKASNGADFLMAYVGGDPVAKDLLGVLLSKVFAADVEEIAAFSNVPACFVFALLKLLVIEGGNAAHKVGTRRRKHSEQLRDEVVKSRWFVDLEYFSVRGKFAVNYEPARRTD